MPYKKILLLPLLFASLLFVFFESQTVFASSDKKASSTTQKDKDKKTDEKKANSKRSQKKSEELSEEEKILQGQMLQQELSLFMRENANRERGTGFLFLARHYLKLDEKERSMAYLKTLLNSDHISDQIRNEALLLLAEILAELERYDEALKELERLLSLEPEREYFVRAKVKISDILGRDLASVDELIKAFKRYYWNYPEQPEYETIEYLIGFQRGYDLQIAMQALVAWEEIAKFPESQLSNWALLRIALLYAFDLNNTQRALEYINQIVDDRELADLSFVKGILHHFYLKDEFHEQTIGFYTNYKQKTDNLDGYRIATVLQSQYLINRAKDADSALMALDGLRETPEHLLASDTISLKKLNELKEEEKNWALLGCKMAAYICEYTLTNPDRALYYYKLGLNYLADNYLPEQKAWLDAAIKRTEPAISQAQMLFEMAYEKYRARELLDALKLYQEFIELYPEHDLYREAMYRVALITDADLRQYYKAAELYQNYLSRFIPQKSTWNLDVLYDWGRIDEVKYRIANLQHLHLKKPLSALKIYEQLVETYPDSYWSQQGLINSVRIYRDELGEVDKAQETMHRFIKLYPENKKSSEYRLTLYKLYLRMDESVKAMEILRDYLDYTLPSEEDYFSYKQQWRDLLFKLREKDIRDRFASSGANDKIDLYNNLLDVYSLASTTQPIEELIVEFKSLDIDEELRWSLVYKGATRLYLNEPAKATTIFAELEQNATGTAKLACLLTLGNIAYRVDKSIKKSIDYYQKSLLLLPLTHQLAEQPLYRLGRLYLVDGHGIKGLETLQRFTSRFPQSRYLGAAYLAMGDACVALNNPERAIGFYNRAVRIMPTSSEEIYKKIDEALILDTSQQWLEKRAQKLKNEAVLPKASQEISSKTKTKSELDIEEYDQEKLKEMEPQALYSFFLQEHIEREPDFKLLKAILYEILYRQNVPEQMRDKAFKHYISCSLLRDPDAKTFATEAQELLKRHNYARWQSELLFRLSQARDYLLKDYEEANKSYFEYISFFPTDRRIIEVRKRIPQLYTKLKDVKNAYRFFARFIDDLSIDEASRVDMAIELAALQFSDDKKDEAIKTLEAALALDSERKPEICIRLERLTEDFSYIRRALGVGGTEKHRFDALKRLIEKAEEDKNYELAAQLFEEYGASFNSPEAILFIEKKTEELGKRDSITAIETLIENFPEEPETVGRMFRLARLIEGMQDTKYRAQDLFYEITLVYPASRYFRESKIRAENVKTIAAISELSDMLALGVKDKKGEEILIERARLLKEKLQDIAGAIENYEIFIKLFPHSTIVGEVYMELADLLLADRGSVAKALNYYQKGLSGTLDPFLRNEITQKIDRVDNFKKQVVLVDDSVNGDMLTEIFKAWRLRGDHLFALALIETALADVQNRPMAAVLNYYAGRIFEEHKSYDRAVTKYETALRSLYHPKCRKDMLIYRIARINALKNNNEVACQNYLALVRRYPKSLLARSAYYWLYKHELSKENLVMAHHYLSNLLNIKSLYPYHKRVLHGYNDELEKKLSVSEIERLKKYSKTNNMSYFAAKMLENDMRDYEAAIEQYKCFLATNPPLRQSRELIHKIADLYEKMGDFVQSISYLDRLLDTFEPSVANLDLIVKIGSILEDKLNNIELAKLFYESVEIDYQRVLPIRKFIEGKLNWIKRKEREALVKPKKDRVVKRIYSEYDQDVIAELKELIEHHVKDLQDFKMAERHLEDLWDEHNTSLATLDIMNALVELNMEYMMDPKKASTYYQRWLDENPNDPLFKEYTLKLYEHYREKTFEGDKALRLLETYIEKHPNTPDSLEFELKVAFTNESLLRNFDEARRGYQRIIDTRTNDPIIHEAYFRLGFVLREGYSNHTEAIKTWQELIDSYFNNDFADQAQFAIAHTYEHYLRDFTNARDHYDKVISRYPNSSMQNEARDGLLRVEGR